MYQTRKHAFMTYTCKYNYKTGLSAKMCNRIFDYKTRLPTYLHAFIFTIKLIKAIIYNIYSFDYKHVYCVYTDYIYSKLIKARICNIYSFDYRHVYCVYCVYTD